MRILFWLPVLLWSCTPSAPVSETTPTSTATPSVTTAPVPGTPSSVPEAAVESDWLITPGQRIGETALGDDPQTLITRLGAPDASDAAMGKAWLVWNGHRQGNTLAVFTAYADTNIIRKAIRQIRVTASRFQTASGIHTGLKLPEIRQAFPSLKQAENAGPDAALRYDDPAQGISFEVNHPGAQAVCTAILIYPAGSSPTAYLPLPEAN